RQYNAPSTLYNIQTLSDRSSHSRLLRLSLSFHPSLFSFFFTAPAPSEIYTLSLHDALPIWRRRRIEVAQHGLLVEPEQLLGLDEDRKSTRLNSSHVSISYAVFCLKKKKKSCGTLLLM